MAVNDGRLTIVISTIKQLLWFINQLILSMVYKPTYYRFPVVDLPKNKKTSKSSWKSSLKVPRKTNASGPEVDIDIDVASLFVKDDFWI